MLLHLCMQDSIKTHDCIIKEIPFIILWLRFEQENAFMAPVVTAQLDNIKLGATNSPDTTIIKFQ